MWLLCPSACSAQRLVSFSTHWKVCTDSGPRHREISWVPFQSLSSFNVTYSIQSLSFQRWTGLFYLISSGLGRAGRQKTRPCLKRLDGRPLQNSSSTHSHGSRDNGQAHSALARLQDSKFFSPNDSFGHKDPMLTICSLVSYTFVHLHKSSPVTL